MSKDLKFLLILTLNITDIILAHFSSNSKHFLMKFWDILKISLKKLKLFGTLSKSLKKVIVINFCSVKKLKF